MGTSLVPSLGSCPLGIVLASVSTPHSPEMDRARPGTGVCWEPIPSCALRDISCYTGIVREGEGRPRREAFLYISFNKDHSSWTKPAFPSESKSFAGAGVAPSYSWGSLGTCPCTGLGCQAPSLGLPEEALQAPNLDAS